MSTSISITISEEHDTKNSKSFSDLRKPDAADCNHLVSGDTRTATDQLYERRHTGLGIGTSTEPNLFKMDPSKLKRWRHYNYNERPGGELQDSTGENSTVDDFYLEVDDKMSRNSFEYPEQQAKYIERWLASAGNGPSGRSKSFDNEPAADTDWRRLNGNVVGIRGFSSESLLMADKNALNKQHRSDYQKLKRDYLKLESDYNQLCDRLVLVNNQHNQSCRRKDVDLAALKDIVKKQGKQLEKIIACKQSSGAPAAHGTCDRCRRVFGGEAASGGIDTEFEQMRFAKNQLGLKLAHQEQEHNALVESLKRESGRMRAAIEERDKELLKLKNEIMNLSLEPSQRRLQALTCENARLKDADDIDRQEFVALRENYQRLETRLRSLIEDQKSLSEEQNDEIRGVLLELCKLQVYQPKLEMILETESQTRLHLQSQLAVVSEEKENLVEQVTSLRRELNEARMGALSQEPVDRLREELLVWQEKYHRLKKDNADLEEAQRVSKSRVSWHDAKAQNEIQLIQETCQQELEQSKREQQKLKTKVAALEVELCGMSEQLTECKSERDVANQELISMHQQLEQIRATTGHAGGATPEAAQRQLESVRNKLKQSEQMILTLQQELSVAALNYKNLNDKLEMAQAKLEHSKQQYDELKRSFDLQQRAFVEMKEKKDKEVYKLRLDLNLEQYNRQVSLKGIEKELRASLRELEAMKFRFSKRFSESTTLSSTTTITTTSPPTNGGVGGGGTRQSSMNVAVQQHTRHPEIKFSDQAGPPPKQPCSSFGKTVDSARQLSATKSATSERMKTESPRAKLAQSPLGRGEGGQCDSCARQSVYNGS